jgi:hypothetical protein
LSTIKRKFDWKSHHDERSKKYSLRSLIGETKIKPHKVMWEEGTVLDQGSEGACVGFGWMAEILATPEAPAKQPEATVANKIALEYYNRAKKLDEWPGETYEGTSVLAGAKAVKEKGLIKEYRWCFSVEDIRDAVILEGPVVIGIPWHKNMYSTLRNGLVTVTGPVVGGHCITITGYDPEFKIGSRVEEVFRWRNSWGTSYGVNGSGYIKVSDLKELLKTSGEACVPIGRKSLSFGVARAFQNIFLKRLFKDG